MLTVLVVTLKLSFFCKADNAVLSSDIMKEMAEYPEMRASFLVIFSLMAFSRGVRSASTRFCARDATSTPEPALSEFMTFCAAARFFAAAVWAAVAVVLDVAVLAVLAVLVLELSAVVAMIQTVVSACTRKT